MRKFKKMAVLTVSAVMMSTLLSGCSIGNTAFKYGDIKVGLPEATVYAKIQQYSAESQFASYYGENMWDIEIQEGVTFEESVKENAIEQIKTVKVLADHAEDMKVSLSEEEKKEVKENVENFVSGDMGKKIMESAEADEELISTIYEENALASKVHDAIIADVDTNVTDEEAKVTTVYKLVFATKKTDTNGEEVTLSKEEQKKQLSKAKKAYRALKKGADMTALAQQYDIADDASESYSAGKSLGGESFEEAVAKLEEGEFTSIIKTDEGYVVAKLVTEMDKEKTEENKETVLEERQQEAYQKQLDQWTKDLEDDWDYEKDVSKKYREDLKFEFGEFSETIETTATTAATEEK